MGNKNSGGRGANNPAWKGGVTKSHSAGYVRVWLPETDTFHPMCDSKGYVYEHRLLMAKSLGRCLTRNEIPHHENKCTSDNRLENLELKDTGSHVRGHLDRKILKHCAYCGKVLKVKRDVVNKSTTGKFFCNHHCTQKHRWGVYRWEKAFNPDLRPRKCLYSGL